MEEAVTIRAPRYRYNRHGMTALIRQLSIVDDRRNAMLLVLQWLIALSAGAIAIRVDQIWIYLIAGIIIGSRLQCLAVMMHDACHGTLFSYRRVNDLIGDLFVAYPLGIGIHLYRASHLRHHRYTNTAEDYDFRFQSSDPDQRFPKSRAGMIWLLIRSLSGLNAPRMFWFARVWLPAANLHNPPHLDIDFRLALRLRYLAWIAIVYGAILLSPFRWQILGLYLIPLFVWSNLFNRMRAMAEHNGVAAELELNGTRTVVPSLLDRFLIVPFNVSYHLEHHLFPSVPGANLRLLHAHLITDPLYSARAHVTQGYWGVIRELLPPPQTSTSFPVVRPD
ncbi:fatty acid desaturase family protein [soil metagenome]